jgi:hypothetical protein
VFLDHVKKLRDLVRLRFPPVRLQAQGSRDLGMAVDVVTAADAERLHKAAEFGEADIPHVARREPSQLSPRTCYEGLGGGPRATAAALATWIPAFAGMTDEATQQR